MNWLNSFIKKSSIRNLSFYLIIFSLIFQCTPLRQTSFRNIFIGEFGILEIMQNIVLLTILYKHFLNIKLLFRMFGRFFVIFKFSLLVLLFYEELSFLSAKFLFISNDINYQNELNIHNSTFFSKQIQFSELAFIPGGGFDISFGNIIYCVSFLLISLIVLLMRDNHFKKYFLLRKKYCFWLLTYPIILIFSWTGGLFFSSPYHLLHPETLELLYYWIILKNLNEDILELKSK